MPLFRVNSIGGTLSLHAEATPPEAALVEAAQRGRGPIVLMVHGYKFRPYDG